VIGCDSCRKLDAEYAQIVKAKKRKAAQEKEEAVLRDPEPVLTLLVSSHSVILPP
jgi:hypothetical protein